MRRLEKVISGGEKPLRRDDIVMALSSPCGIFFGAFAVFIEAKYGDGSGVSVAILACGIFVTLMMSLAFVLAWAVVLRRAAWKLIHMDVNGSSGFDST